MSAIRKVYKQARDFGMTPMKVTKANLGRFQSFVDQQSSWKQVILSKTKPQLHATAKSLGYEYAIKYKNKSVLQKWVLDNRVASNRNELQQGQREKKNTQKRNAPQSKSKELKLRQLRNRLPPKHFRFLT